MNPEEYCKDRTTRSGSSFYYSFLFLEPQQRKAITALYAFCREVDDIVDECRDPNLARIKLQWWREDLAKTFDGAPQHPVNQELVSVVQQFNLPIEHFLEIIDGMEMDLDNHDYPSFRDLALYCHRVAGIVGLMSAEIFGYNDRNTLKYANELGIAFQLTNILRDVREDASRGRVYIPLDELARFNVSREDILSPENSVEMLELLKHQAKRANEYYDRAFSLLGEQDRYPQRSGIIMAAIYKTVLKEIENDYFRVMTHRVKLNPLRKLWIAWNTARKEKRLHKMLATAKHA
ncbi:MAG: presqualene diphosphate synthase HpnD [Gammaproteobacteria bacterium]|nr:MAG: presqualene diphosphate synthase HpnD [Gammaproteobacteria bacterium]